MSEYTREEILKLIEGNGGPEGLDLSGKNLSGIDLSTETLAAELEHVRETTQNETPVWFDTLTGGINLRRANLQETSLVLANLQGIRLGDANLQGADLKNANLQGAHLDDANLQGAKMWDANFQKAYLPRANLQKADLRHANFKAAYLEAADLREAFVKYADLREANLEQANLQGASLQGVNLQEASLWGANLEGANLNESNLQGAKMLGANLQDTRLEQADLQKADLRSANFHGAYLWRANLREADLAHADLREANLDGVKLRGVNLSNCHLEKTELFSVESLEGAYFYNAFLDDTRMKREQLGRAIGEELEGRYRQAKEAYLALKNNFAEIGRHEDESWAYRKERRMEKATKAPWRCRGYYGREEPFPHPVRELFRRRGLNLRGYALLPRRSPLVWWFWIKYMLKWLVDWFVQLLCGYGESIGRVAAWMLLVILGFAAYYQVSHAVVTSSQDAATSLWDHLIFSLGAFTTLQPARLQAARPGVELLTTIQAIIGISLAGLLGFVAGNRIRRS